jgi:hypothetical protein
MARTNEHLAALLDLPLADRAQAAHALLCSLDDNSDSGAESLSIAELVRRAQAVRDGTAATVDGAEARARVVKRLRAVRS